MFYVPCILDSGGKRVKTANIGNISELEQCTGDRLRSQYTHTIYKREWQTYKTKTDSFVERKGRFFVCMLCAKNAIPLIIIMFCV